jgi:adenylate cyclase
VFDRLREDVDAIARLTDMTDVFKLRAADIYRVVDIELVPAAVHLGAMADPLVEPRRQAPPIDAVGALTARLSRCGDLDTLVAATVDGLHELLGYEHSQLLLVDEDAERLYTIASHGYGAEGVGAEVRVGDGAIGVAAQRCAPVRIGNLRQMGKYGRSVRRGFETQGELAEPRTIPLPGLAAAESQLAVPAMSLGQLVGVLAVESTDWVAFSEGDEAALTMIATVVANAIEVARAEEQRDTDAVSPRPAGSIDGPAERRDDAVALRFFAADGSVFLDDEYLIKGVAGRILWWLARQHAEAGRTEFTNKEVRLNPELDLPEYRDNLESRLILLKRRLDERQAPLRIEKTGRGRFRLVSLGPVCPEAVTS